MSEYPDLLTALREVQAEAERALEGLSSGSIPRGTTALVNVKYIAQDALADEDFSRSPEATVIP